MDANWPQWFEATEFAEPDRLELWWRPFDSIDGPKIGDFITNPKEELGAVFGITDDWVVSVMISNVGSTLRWRKGKVAVALVREQKVAAAMVVKLLPDPNAEPPELEPLDW